MAKFSICIFLLLLFTSSLLAQNITMSEKLDDEKVERFAEDVRQMVSFLEFLLNSLGDSETSTAQKNTIIDETYKKVFRDNKIQVEDDLLPNRDVITNKDVQAYLKDISFFYKGAKFDLQVESVDYFINQNGEHSYKVSMNRILRGLSVESDSVLITGPRYMEVVLDVLKEDIKIVSFYSSLIAEENLMTNWWNELHPSLQDITAAQIFFTKDLSLAELRKTNPELSIGDTLSTDSVDVVIRNQSIFHSIRNLQVMTELDCKGMTELTDISGLSTLKNLRRLDISETGVTDVNPLQSLENLEVLLASSTRISNPDPLRSLSKLRSLDLSKTQIKNAYFLKNMTGIKKLNLSETAIDNSNYFSMLENLQELNLSYTKLSELLGLHAINSLVSLNIDGSEVKELGPLSNMKHLEHLSANHTMINSITALLNVPTIKKIYCDESGIKREEATGFMREKPGTLVVFESKMLGNWWKTLEKNYQSIFGKFQLKNKLPSNEALQELTLIEELDLSGHDELQQINSLTVFFNLKSLDISSTGIADINALSQIKTLENINISSNPITDITALSQLTNLSVIDLSSTKIKSIEPLLHLEELRWLSISNSPVSVISDLSSLKNLKIIYCEKIGVAPYRIAGAVKLYSNVLFIYNTEFLNGWWKKLSSDWQEVFMKHIEISSEPRPEELHKVVQLDSLHFTGNRSMNSLEPISALTNLHYLYFSNTGAGDLDPLRFLGKLKRLKLPENPVSDLSPLKDLIKLEELDISNTPISDLRDLEFFINLKKINCAGSQVKNLKYLRNLDRLEHIELQNTPINNLSSLNPEAPLKTLTCYNTKLSSRKLEAFKEKYPDCQVIFY